MTTFQYKAKQKDAKTVTGQVIAKDRPDAIEKINQMELVPVQVEELAVSGRAVIGGGFGQGKSQTLYHFSRQLVSLLKGGVPILKSLEIIARQQKNLRYRHLIESIHLSLREGSSFSDCLTAYPQIFPSLYIAMVKAGEESGNLKETIADLAEYFRIRQEITSKIKNALAYPFMMVLLGLGSVIFVLTYVLPKLTVLYNQFGQSLPGATRLVIRLSNFFINDWAWILLVFVVIMGLIKRSAKLPQARLRFDQMILRFPAIGPFLVKVEMMRFFRTLELLLKSGVPVVKAVTIATPVVHNEQIRAELEKCRERLMTGRSFTESLKEIKSMPDAVGMLIAVGEESGNITESLHDIAENYAQETAESVKVMTTLLEPLLIIMVGAVIGFIVIAMLLPIFSLDMMAS